MERIKNIFNRLTLPAVGAFWLITLLFLVFLALYWGKFGDPVVDCGREAYIPYSMAFLGKVLYKDIICIYGPVPYYLNALIMRLFGPSLNTLCFIGAILSYLFLFGLFNISKCLFGHHLAFYLSLITLFACILTPSISNFIFPYSYATVWAVVFAVFYLYFLLNFIDTKTPKALYLAAFFLSLALLSKFDFAPSALVIIVLAFLYRKNLDFKAFLGTVLAFISPLICIFAIFLYQKVSLQDLIFNFKMISNMAHSPSLAYFYSLCTGFFFDFKKTFMYLPKFLVSTALCAAVFSLFARLSGVKNRLYASIARFFVIIIPAFIIYSCCLRSLFTYIPLLIVFFTVFYFIKILHSGVKNKLNPFDDKVIRIFSVFVFCLLISLKSLFGLFHELYGVYYLPFILLSLFLGLYLIFQNRENTLKEGLKGVAALVVLMFALQNFTLFSFVKNAPVKTPAGTLYTSASLAYSLNETFKFLSGNLNDKDTVLPLPEGLFLNFALRRDYPAFNTSFTPLDFDAYGENYLTEQVLANPPKYILMLSREYGDYGKTFLCKDFGVEFCSKINNKYTFKLEIPENHSGARLKTYPIRIFERNEK